MSVHYKRFSGWIHGISLAQVELAVVVAGHVELVLTVDRCLEEASDLVEARRPLGGVGDLEVGHELLPILGESGEVARISTAVIVKLASEAMLAWVDSLPYT